MTDPRTQIVELAPRGYDAVVDEPGEPGAFQWILERR